MDELVTIRVRRKISDTLYGEVLECELPRSADAGNADLETVAVKVVSLAQAATAQRGADGRAVDNPSREMTVTRLLAHSQQHPHVAGQIGQTIRSGVMYIISEYYGGGDLYSYLDSQRPHRHLTEHQAAGFMRQIIKGVQFLHETLGIAHRDLSLENILLTADGVCKITDFALSVDAGEVHQDRAGKDLYMAPEVVARRAYDPIKADIWSLGIMWFILLTGTPLLPIACPSQAGFRVIERRGLAIVLKKWGLDSRMSRATVDLLGSMLQVDPQRRISLRAILSHPALARRSPVSS